MARPEGYRRSKSSCGESFTIVKFGLKFHRVFSLVVERVILLDLRTVQLRQTHSRGSKSSPTAHFKDTAGENRGWLLATDSHDPTSRCLTSRRSVCRLVIAEGPQAGGLSARQWRDQISVDLPRCPPAAKYSRIPLVRSRLARFPALYADFLKSRLHLYNMYVIRSPLLRSAIPLSTFRFVTVIGL
ncbi:hypothetical protein T12_7977 [Trichinella patagoniensis]|uniref:Uncharacterized protein n=1 Tax=Trichinella patagoniensis TaxID=990121 RepID=A0A0V0Z4B8_9BILA|nr:hypothetical protein T12_7977 [Trichinella patagoniensis]